MRDIATPPSGPRLTRRRATPPSAGYHPCISLTQAARHPALEGTLSAAYPPAPARDAAAAGGTSTPAARPHPAPAGGAAGGAVGGGGAMAAHVHSDHAHSNARYAWLVPPADVQARLVAAAAEGEELTQLEEDQWTASNPNPYPDPNRNRNPNPNPKQDQWATQTEGWRATLATVRRACDELGPFDG